MKKIVALSLCLALCVALLAGCGKKSDKTITVAASPAPHAAILGVAKEILAEQGITLEIKEFNDYRQPNFATESGDVMANYFQHIAYLDAFNRDEKTNLVNVAEIHYEPYGLYPGKTATIEELKPGAQIAITNDPSNQGRALRLLETQGLIKLKEDAGLEATPKDIVEYKVDLKFFETEAAQLPAALSSVDMAVINGNYAIGADLDVNKDAIAVEKNSDSESAAQYANVLVVKKGNEENELVKALIDALKSDKVRDYIEKNYSGSVVPLF